MSVDPALGITIMFIRFRIQDSGFRNYDNVHLGVQALVLNLYGHRAAVCGIVTKCMSACGDAPWMYGLPWLTQGERCASKAGLVTGKVDISPFHRYQHIIYTANRYRTRQYIVFILRHKIQSLPLALYSKMIQFISWQRYPITLKRQRNIATLNIIV